MRGRKGRRLPPLAPVIIFLIFVGIVVAITVVKIPFP